MKASNIKVTIKSRAQVLQEFGEAFENLKKGEPVLYRNELSFGSLEALRKVLTEKRTELLKAIKEKSPESVYGLAKLVSRDLKSVSTDLKILKSLGLVSLAKSNEGRFRVRPEVLFDKLSIEIAV
ncbi:hypothetical protein HYU40_05095 [Candidatus Woesearchaeota archaeon]|nr:hypothetical protein [Candidatus Woesearchaeota archaeon]